MANIGLSASTYEQDIDTDEEQPEDKEDEEEDVSSNNYNC